MGEQINSLKKTARIAGLWYLALVIIGVYGLMYVQSQIFVDGNPLATTNNVIAHEFLFRTGISIAIAGNFIFLFLVLALYHLLERVNKRQAKLMVILVILQLPVSFLLELVNFTALMILKGDALKTLDNAQRHDFAALFLRIHSYGINILEVFWGIWLVPLGQLVYKSGFIPRIIGVLLIVGGAAYMAASFVFLLFPDYFSFIAKFIIIASLGEIAIMLWLLIKGVKAQKAG